MSRRTGFVIIAIVALAALAAGVWVGAGGSKTGYWAADSSVEGASVQLAATYSPAKPPNTTQLACDAKRPLKRERLSSSQATRICTLLSRKSNYYKTLMDKATPECAAQKAGWQVHFRGEIDGQRIDRVFKATPCDLQDSDYRQAAILIGLFSGQRSSAPGRQRSAIVIRREEERRLRQDNIAARRGGLMPCPKGVKTTSYAPCSPPRDLEKRIRDPRPDSDRLFPCPPGKSSTPSAPCREQASKE